MDKYNVNIMGGDELQIVQIVQMANWMFYVT